MVDSDKLRGLIVEQKKSQTDVAKYLDISPKTFYRKMEKRVFGSDEIESMIEYLKIEDPVSVFFKPTK